jgi:hypothetical protein
MRSKLGGHVYLRSIHFVNIFKTKQPKLEIEPSVLLMGSGQEVYGSLLS